MNAREASSVMWIMSQYQTTTGWEKTLHASPTVSEGMFTFSWKSHVLTNVGLFISWDV